WDLVGAGAHTQPVAFFAALTVLCTVPVAGALLAAHRFAPSAVTRGSRSPRRIRAVSHWARTRDMRGLMARTARPGRFVLGTAWRRLVLTERETSVLVVGPTRSGKTTCLVVPNLLEWRGPAIVTSTKGELLALTAAHRQRMGPVYVYDPTGELGERVASVTW